MPRSGPPPGGSAGSGSAPRSRPRTGAAARLFGIKQDITEEIARLAELSRRAERDPLTGLANRRGFEARFDGRDGRSGPDPSAPCC